MSSNDQNNTAPKDVSDIFGTVKFPLKAHRSPHGRITAVSMMKDEGPFVLEWVAHHLALGFTDIVVYTNDCSDGTDAMLMRLEELGLAHHRRNDIPDGIRPQPSALKYAQKEPIVQNSDWVLVFDADEFLCIKLGDGSLDGMISAAEAQGANGIVITWRIYGSNGVQEWSRAPVTEQYLSAAPPMWNKGWGVKTLFKFDPDYWKLGIHRPKIKNKHLETDFPHSVKWLNGSGRQMEEYFKFRGWRSIVRTVGYDWAQMNHYAIKSMDSYAIRKFRGNVNNKKDKYNADYWSLQDRNEVFDDAALNHAERRTEIFDQLMTDPVLSKLHFDAVARVEARLADYKQTPEYAELIAGLKTASEVPITQVEAKPPKARDPEKIAAQMSKIEKSLSNKPKVTLNTPLDPALSSDARPYLDEPINLSAPFPVKTFTNHGIEVPADPRVFTDAALQTITEGKFMRNHARRLPGLLQPSDRLLEIGAGVGFLAAHVGREFPQMAIAAQEERATLRSVAAKIWRANKVPPAEGRGLVDAPLFHDGDGTEHSTGLRNLIVLSKCTVLYVNDPRLTARMILNALAIQEGHLPHSVIIAPRALAGECDQEKCTHLLGPLGYRPAPDQILNAALTLIRKETP